MNKNLIYCGLVIFFNVLITSCIQNEQNNTGLSDPKIEVGIGKVSGTIIDLRKNKEQEVSTIYLYTSNLIMADNKPFEILVNEDGSLEAKVISGPNSFFINPQGM